MKKYYILIILACLVLNAEAKKPIEKQKNKHPNEKINLKPASWFSDIMESIASLWQPVWGKYTEGGSTNKSYPLACADRKTEIADLREILIEKIKIGQYHDPTIKNIYTQIFINASNLIESCPKDGTCPAASIIKDAAFVYWLGVNDTGGTLSAGARLYYP